MSFTQNILVITREKALSCVLRVFPPPEFPLFGEIVVLPNFGKTLNRILRSFLMSSYLFVNSFLFLYSIFNEQKSRTRLSADPSLSELAPFFPFGC